MSHYDRFLITAIRFLLASAFVGACLLCEAAALLGYADYWVVGLLRWLTP